MNILCIHQGYELYGSDRSFLQSIQTMRQKWPHAHITAVIPQKGPLYQPLQRVADAVKIEDLWVPRKNALARLFTYDLLRLPVSIWQAARKMRDYDLVYINTLTILNYNIAARFTVTPAVIHVREIVGSRASAVFSAILRFSRAAIIFNSEATQRAFRISPHQPGEVIYNGVPDVPETAAPKPGKKLKLLLLGRFNSWKGHDLLVEAITRLHADEQAQLEVRMVGGVFENQQHFVQSIKRQITRAGLDHVVHISPFTENTAGLYAWADAVLVPSRKPEPFGRVATEAMSYSRPVIAANHGGLTEIVEDEQTGWLFRPNDSADLAGTLSHVLAHRGEITQAGNKARKRFLQHFSEQHYQAALVSAFEKHKTAAIHAKKVRILGIRGVPANHGGFETFADYFARFLAQKGWEVVVYCQEEGPGQPYETTWHGVRRVHIPVRARGSKGSIIFDGLSAWHASKEPGLVLTLGYNTAFYSLLFRLKNIPNLINMDGIEWKRGKWSKPVQLWFWINEHLACRLGNHLIADHPEMKRHLLRNVAEDKITVSAYGAEAIKQADETIPAIYGLEPKQYATLIARAEPENSILQIVRAWSAKKRGIKLVVLGNYSEHTPYQKAVKQAASDEVHFIGSVYNHETVSSLRYHSLFYLHGHTVGGTNPSLIEALGAGNPVIAHDNRFNRWVAGSGARYFQNESECSQILSQLLSATGQAELKAMAEASRARHAEAFQWDHILTQQEAILLRALQPNFRKDHASSEPEMKPASIYSRPAGKAAQHNA